MKKLLIISMSLLFLEQFGLASTSRRRSLTSKLKSKEVSNFSKKSIKKNSGSAENLATALGIKLSSLKEYQGTGIFFLPWGKGYKWEDALDEKYVYELDEKGNRKRDNDNDDIKRELTLEELEEKTIEKINKVVDWYAKKYKSAAFSHINQDIQAFQEEFEKDKIQNVDLQEKIKSLIAVAEEAEQDLYIVLIEEKTKDLLKDNTIDVAITSATSKYSLAQELKNESDIDLYKKVQAKLEEIKEELKNVKKRYKTQDLTKAKSILQGFKDDEDFDQEFIYTSIVDLLKNQKDASEKVNKNIEDMIDKDGELQALKKSEKDLDKIKKKLSDAKRVDRDEDVIEKLEMDVKEQKNIVYELQLKSERAIEEKMDKLLEKNDNDPKKALDSLLSTYKNKSYFSSIKNTLTSYDDQIANIKEDTKENRLDRAVAQQLYDQIKEVEQELENKKQEAKANDPVNIALAQLRASKLTDYGTSINNVAAAMFDKAGVNIDMLSVANREKLVGYLKNTSEQMIMVAQDKTMSYSAQQAKKQEVMKRMVKDVSYLLAESTIGVSKKALESKDAATIGMDIAINNLTKKLLGSQNQKENVSSLDDYNF